MRLGSVIILSLALGCVPIQVEAATPVASGAEGQRAFNDLAAIYPKGPYAEFQAPVELTNLEGPDPAKAQKAAEYVLALFEQSWADETNGRTTWRALPFWNGGSENPARAYRGNLADAFGKSASSRVALPIALWLIKQELVEDNIAAGALALSRIQGTEADAAIGAILQEQHPSQQVLLTALHEAAARHLVHFEPSVVTLEQSYRPTVRDAANRAQMSQVPDI